MLRLFTVKGARNSFYDVVGCLGTQNLYITIHLSAMLLDYISLCVIFVASKSEIYLHKNYCM